MNYEYTYIEGEDWIRVREEGERLATPAIGLAGTWRLPHSKAYLTSRRLSCRRRLSMLSSVCANLNRRNIDDNHMRWQPNVGKGVSCDGRPCLTLARDRDDKAELQRAMLDLLQVPF